MDFSEVAVLIFWVNLFFSGGVEFELNCLLHYKLFSNISDFYLPNDSNTTALHLLRPPKNVSSPYQMSLRGQNFPC